MNINLLPDKFIKNKASDIILLVTGFTVVLTIIVLTFLLIYYQLTVSNYTGKVTSQRVEKVTIEKQVEELHHTQLVDLQDSIAELKQEQRLAASIMTQFSEVANSVEVTLLSYELYLGDSVEETSQDGVAGDGSQVLPSITLRVRGDFYTGGVKLKEALEKIEWVYDVKPISVTKEVDYSESDYTIRLKKEGVPATARLETVQND